MRAFLRVPPPEQEVLPSDPGRRRLLARRPSVHTTRGGWEGGSGCLPREPVSVSHEWTARAQGVTCLKGCAVPETRPRRTSGRGRPLVFLGSRTPFPILPTGNHADHSPMASTRERNGHVRPVTTSRGAPASRGAPMASWCCRAQPLGSHVLTRRVGT